MTHKHWLNGCSISPISNYLKALGVSRTLFVRDPEITSYWKHNMYVINTTMDTDDIVEFLLEKYRPVPAVNPWSYDVYRKSKETMMELFEYDKNRFELYKKTVDKIDLVFEKLVEICSLDEITKPNVDKHKTVLLKLCRNYLPDEVVPWLDALCAIDVDKPSFAPILGSGGNDGRFDMSRGFVRNIQNMIAVKDEKTHTKSKDLLKAALFGDIIALSRVKTIGHNPAGSGGPNFGNGYDGEALSNPWDYILMMEGIVLFAGSVSKHLSGNIGKAVFPFTASASTVGYHTASADDTDGGQEPSSRGEMWLPIWERPTTHKEISHIFAEGRVQLGRKHARTGTEFARSIVTLGTERGITEFQRYCILKRKGKAYLVINAGSIHTKYSPAAKLLEDLDRWYGLILKKSNEKGAPASLVNQTRNMESIIIKFCTNPEPHNLLKVLIHVGKLERYIAIREGFEPLQNLSEDWLSQCYDNSAEFRLAAAIASIYEIRGIRENLESAVKNKHWVHKRSSTSCVWRDNDTTIRNLEAVLYRRALEGQMESHKHKHIPIHGIIPAKMKDILMFLHGKLDMNKIGELILPLSFINITHNTYYPWKNEFDMEYVPLLEAYAVMKMMYPSHDEENIPYDVSVLNLLRAHRHDDAYKKVSYILHAHGMSPRTKPKHDLPKMTTSDLVQKHLMASLLFPIHNSDRQSMQRSMIIPSRQT